ncbi:hypothetical protein [Streptomyces filamentosus]|uniref:hypothetical protein n=1 Tax=Streptomyces filamentosus TaxID=67294 RepID=UPI001F368E41|nr:hypothetical protein [Streptomyces filamentosus]
MIHADRQVVVAFEPTAAEFSLLENEMITVEWFAESEDGMVSMEGDNLVVSAPSGGYTRAWRRDGTEIYVGPESGSEAS